MITYILIHKWGCHSPASCQILISTAHYNPVLCVDKHNFHNVSWTFLLIYLATETFISWTPFASIIQSIYLSLFFFSFSLPFSRFYSLQWFAVSTSPLSSNALRILQWLPKNFQAQQTRKVTWTQVVSAVARHFKANCPPHCVGHGS